VSGIIDTPGVKKAARSPLLRSIVGGKNEFGVSRQPELKEPDLVKIWLGRVCSTQKKAMSPDEE